MPVFADLRPAYAKLWEGMKVNPLRVGNADAIARRLIQARSRYLNVEARTSVPWFVIACIHERESGQDWDKSLAQGDPWNEVSTHVPAGRGPFRSWEEAAIDALHFDGLDKVTDWSAESICFNFEKFNGFGYQGKINSPYLWSWSNQYSQGKYVADGVYDPLAIDKQCGTMVMLSRMMAMDASIDLTKPVPSPIPGEPPPRPAPLPKPEPKPRPMPHPAPAIGGLAALLAAVSLWFNTHHRAGPAVHRGHRGIRNLYVEEKMTSWPWFISFVLAILLIILLLAIGVFLWKITFRG